VVKYGRKLGTVACKDGFAKGGEHKFNWTEIRKLLVASIAEKR